MRLKNLVLDNFRHFPHFEFVPDGQDATIYGANGVGKTTIFNAITWLLFNKSCNDEDKFTPKTNDKDGNPVHHLEHSAEAVFLKDDGGWITLKKIYKEKYTKKQGTGDTYFDGHETVHYIDGVNLSMTNYKRTITQIFCDEEQAMILTMPRYFLEKLPWQKRREILMEMAGGILTDADIIASKKELQPLENYLKGYGVKYTIDQLLKIAKDERKGLLADKEDIPVKINEAHRVIQEVDFTEAALEKKMTALEKKVAKLEEQKASLSDGETVAILRQEIANYKVQLAEAQAKFAQENNGENARLKLFMQQKEVESKQIEQQMYLQTLIAELAMASSNRERMVQERERLIAQISVVMAEEWQGDTICPTCNRPLPADKIDEAKALFNQDKSERKSALNKRGKEQCDKELIAAAEKRIEELQAQILAVRETLAGYVEQLDSLQQQATQIVIPVFEESNIYKELMAQIALIEQKIAAGSQSTTEAKDKLQAEIFEQKRQLMDLQNKYFILQANEKQRERIGVLEEEEKRLSAVLEEIEYKINLCEKFTQTKTELLTGSINSKFHNISFKLFDQQVNGGYAECCEAMVPGANNLSPYTSANEAGKENAGLEIINALGRYWGVTLPIFVDGAESYTNLIDTDSQKVRLVVSAKDRKLRIEIGSTSQTEADEDNENEPEQLTVQDFAAVVGAEF